MFKRSVIEALHVLLSWSELLTIDEIESLEEVLAEVRERAIKASDKLREGRRMAFDREDLAMVKVLREIQELLDSVI